MASFETGHVLDELCWKAGTSAEKAIVVEDCVFGFAGGEARARAIKEV